MDNLVLTPTAQQTGQELLRWCVYAGPHPNDSGWLMIFRFANGLQATVAYGPYSNGISVGVMDGDSVLKVWDWLDGSEVVERLFDVRTGGAALRDGVQ